ncbi:MAG: O-antigen ligase family protein [bacterium]
MIKIKSIDLSSPEKTLLFLIKGGIFLTLFLPFVISPLNIFPSIFSKSIYFRVLTEIILCGYLILLLFNQKYRPRLSFIFIAVLVFIEAFGLSTLRSVNPYRSFWGTMERMEGFISLLHLFAFFVVATSVFREEKGFLKFFRFFVILSVPLALTGIIQKLGISALFAKPDYTTGGIIGPLVFTRVSGLLGNPVFFGNYLAVMIFLALFFVFAEKTRKGKIFFVSAAILNASVLLLTGTRGAWVATLLGGTFLSLVWLFFINKSLKKRRIFFLATFVCVGLLSLFLFLSQRGLLPVTDFFTRYQSFFDSAVAKNSRIYVWETGLTAVKERPFFGFGLESFNYVYNKHYRVQTAPYALEEFSFDRAHNVVVDLLVAGGMIGLISYLLIFAMSVFVIWRWKNDNNRLLSFALLAFLIAYFVENIFSFDTITSYFTFFLFLVFIDVEFFTREAKNDLLPASSPQNWTLTRIIGAILVVLFSGIIIFSANVSPFLANYYLGKGHNLFARGKITEGLDYMKKSLDTKSFVGLENNFYFSTIIYLSSNYFLGSQINTPESQIIFQEMEEEAKRLEEWYGDKPEIKEMDAYILLAQVYKNLYFNQGNKDFLTAEEKVLAKAISLNPDFVKPYRFAGEMNFLKGNSESGNLFLLKAYELDKNIINFYEWRAHSLLLAGEAEKGAADKRTALKLNGFYSEKKFDVGVVWQIAEIYKATKNYQEMVNFYEEVLRYYPENIPLDPQIYTSLAATYLNLGEKQKAREMVEQMILLFPGFYSQSDDFMRQIEEAQ